VNRMGRKHVVDLHAGGAEHSLRRAALFVFVFQMPRHSLSHACWLRVQTGAP
jgi:hypothetical protein